MYGLKNKSRKERGKRECIICCAGRESFEGREGKRGREEGGRGRGGERGEGGECGLRRSEARPDCDWNLDLWWGRG